MNEIPKEILDTLTPNERFFVEHGGYGYNPQTETPLEGQIRSAKEMALAWEYRLSNPEWYCTWERDPDGCTGCECGSPECPCSSGKRHVTLVCLLWDGLNVLESLGGICGATKEYKRVVETELVQEAMIRVLGHARGLRGQVEMLEAEEVMEEPPLIVAHGVVLPFEGASMNDVLG